MFNKDKNRQSAIDMTFECGRLTFFLYSNNAIVVSDDSRIVYRFYSKAKEKNLGWIDTQNAKRTHFTFSRENNYYYISVFYATEQLQLTQRIVACEDRNIFTVSVELSGKEQVSSNLLIPLYFPEPDENTDSLFSSLKQKMLLIPYDNDAWVRYEDIYPRPGSVSYDFSCIFNEETSQTLLLGALDFDVFKNAVRCRANEIHGYEAISGIADIATHDCLPHGYVCSTVITSSRFICGLFATLKQALYTYGCIVSSRNKSMRSTFGWSYCTDAAQPADESTYYDASDFILNSLNNFYNTAGAACIHLGNMRQYSSQGLIKLVNDLHKRNQKVGITLSPLSYNPLYDKVPLKGTMFKSRKELIMKMPDGTPYEAINGKLPIDITSPLAISELKQKLQEIVDLQIDCVTFEDLSYGAIEGKRNDENIVTGRQAYAFFMSIVKGYLSYEKARYPLDIVFGSSPLFPNPIANGRKICCRVYEHQEDTKYLLNALTYGYWMSGTLYGSLDSDRTLLYSSQAKNHSPSTPFEARSRYYASLICGGAITLSDRYSNIAGVISAHSKERALRYANNPLINQIASLGAFEPLSISTSNNAFFKKAAEGTYIVLFNFKDEVASFDVKMEDFGIEDGLNISSIADDIVIPFQKMFRLNLRNHDSVILYVRNPVSQIEHKQNNGEIISSKEPEKEDSAKQPE